MIRRSQGRYVMQGAYSKQGVQYVHCVMHKCIMVKVGGGNEIHTKHVKTREFFESRGKFVKVEGKIKCFAKQGERH